MQVADGSPLMSPANRMNPDTTAADGSFGWGRRGGYYVVTAQKQDCVSAADHSVAAATSAVMAIAAGHEPRPAAVLRRGDRDAARSAGRDGRSATTPKPVTSGPPATSSAASGAGAAPSATPSVASQARLTVSARRARLHRGHRVATVRTRVTIDRSAKLTLKIVDRATKRAVTLRRGSKAGPRSCTTGPAA